MHAGAFVRHCAFVHACMLTCASGSAHVSHACLHACMYACLPVCLPACMLTCGSGAAHVSHACMLALARDMARAGWEAMAPPLTFVSDESLDGAPNGRSRRPDDDDDNGGGTSLASLLGYSDDSDDEEGDGRGGGGPSAAEGNVNGAAGGGSKGNERMGQPGDDGRTGHPGDDGRTGHPGDDGLRGSLDGRAAVQDGDAVASGTESKTDMLDLEVRWHTGGGGRARNKPDVVLATVFHGLVS
eukprot:366381-Chlamydomonas_euryale.AAC.1